MPLKFKKKLSTPILSGHGRSEGYIDVRTHTHEKNFVFVRAEENKKKNPDMLKKKVLLPCVRGSDIENSYWTTCRGIKLKSIILK